MKKIFILLVILVTFSSCKKMSHRSKIELHSYITNDDEGFIYWYLFYGQNNNIYYYNSRVPLTDIMDISWNISNSVPQALNGTKELPITEEEINEEPTEEADTETDSETDSSNDSDSSSDSSDSGDSGDSGGGDGGGE